MTRIDGNARVHACVALLATTLVILASAACGSGLFGKVYEYEEDVHVSLDGSADVTVNASVAALVALRGLSLNPDPSTRLDRDQVRAAFTSPLLEVTRVSRPWRRFGRQFVQVRLRVPDIRKLTQVAPFSWSTYEVGEKEGVVVYRQDMGASALRPGTLQNFGWQGGELIAVRLHLPSKIVYHNARDLETNQPSSIARGNILAWEQALTDRLDGKPLAIEVRMDRQSILYHTLWLFVSAFAAAIVLIALIIWWMVAKGTTDHADSGQPA
jgi:hypothetical protein